MTAWITFNFEVVIKALYAGTALEEDLDDFFWEP